MNICDERYLHALAFEFGFDVAQVFRFIERRRGNANDFATGFHQLNGFGHRGRRVHGIADGHRLDTNGIVAANPHVADFDFTGFAAMIGKGVRTVGW